MFGQTGPVPEGDTIHNLALRFRPALVGRRMERVRLRDAPGGRRLSGQRIERVEAIGKHLVLITEAGWALRTHLGMVGSWGLLGMDEPWRQVRARVVLEAPPWRAVCWDPPDVAVFHWARRSEHAPLARLGPDLLGSPEPAWDEVLARARAWRGPTMEAAELLLAQSVACGIGNVYKCELLFLERVSPWAHPASLGDGAVLGLYRLGARLLRDNLGPGPRVTAPRSLLGSSPRDRGRGLWVYERDRLPCRVCGAAIEVQRQGAHARPTWWCPRCQGGREAARGTGG